MAPPKFVINEPIPIRGGPNDKAIKPAVIEITQAMSEPADPDAPSFLTTLPAEIRNAVYEILFRRCKPIEILDKNEQREWPDWSDEFAEPDDERARIEAAIYRTRKTHDFDNGISLLRTCRQIYWESIRVLYGSNTFCVTVPEHLHNSDGAQMTTAANFIQSIGTHAFLITELSIDMGRLCPRDCSGRTLLNFLPLANVLWSRPGILPRLRFNNGEYRMAPPLHDISEYALHPQIPVIRLSRILHALVDQDHLHLRRYSRFERLATSLHMRFQMDSTIPGPYPDLIWLRFGSRGCLYTIFNIDEHDGNLSLSFETTRRHLTLDQLPHASQSRIMQSVLAQKKIIFDLDKRTVTGLQNAALQINRHFREIAQCCLASSSQFTVKMVASEAKTSFQDFERLRDWADGSYGQIISDYSYDTDTAPPLRILLYIDSPDTTLRGLRIDVKCFIFVTWLLRDGTIVRISTISSKTIQQTEEVYETNLQTLRRRCFILLSAMLLQNPNYTILPAPTIWIDGTGMPTKVAWVLPEAGCIRSGSDFPLTTAALHAAGLNYIKEIDNRHGENGRPWFPSSLNPRLQDTLESLWGFLRECDWDDQERLGYTL
ncbi:hypothetical protein E8E13_008470 [Curvularia kusanoi]|uniref:DUF7730 domain-containing protein n=1 Tax=Curvularia kusanoi TaxID=90978 RepID=A0A9P4TF76_CURKU|nr:hypothetical protein E8E13_008470 [Curvularia kusanoi]